MSKYLSIEEAMGQLACNAGQQEAEAINDNDQSWSIGRGMVTPDGLPVAFGFTTNKAGAVDLSTSSKAVLLGQVPPDPFWLVEFWAALWKAKKLPVNAWCVRLPSKADQTAFEKLVKVDGKSRTVQGDKLKTFFDARIKKGYRVGINRKRGYQFFIWLTGEAQKSGREPSEASKALADFAATR